MFKRGDIIYCVDVVDVKKQPGVKISEVELDTPYIVKTNVGGCITLRGNKKFVFFEERFISEQEYNISKRLEKVSKIKDEIHR